MDKEQIIKDIEELLQEHCAHDYKYSEKICGYETIKDAIALIKELTEELEKERTWANSMIDNLRDDIEELTNENKELIKNASYYLGQYEKKCEECERLMESECDHCACVLLDQRDDAREEAEKYKKYYFHRGYDKWEAEIKVETVRKMQEDIAMHFGTYTDKDEVKVLDVVRLINRITEEILEEGNG